MGASLQAEGQFVPGPKSDGSRDFEVSQLHIFGRCDPRDYPFKARTSHSLDYLRQLPHLRPRTSTFSAVLRLRNAATMAFHQYFQVCVCAYMCVCVHMCQDTNSLLIVLISPLLAKSAGFWLVHTPVLTSSDCEGSGELFGVQVSQTGQVRVILFAELSVIFSGLGFIYMLHLYIQSHKVSDHSGEPLNFFGIPVYLTVSGQLHAEALAWCVNPTVATTTSLLD